MLILFSEFLSRDILVHNVPVQHKYILTPCVIHKNVGIDMGFPKTKSDIRYVKPEKGELSSTAVRSIPRPL